MKKATLSLLLFTCLQQIAFSQNIPLHSKLFFTSKEKSRVSIDSIYCYRFIAIDSSNKPFSFIVKSLPAWLHYNTVMHSVSGKPLKPGQYAVHIIASNADTTVHQRFMLTVYNRNTTNILCLGNSITNGTGKYNSYRRALWQLLHKNNYNFDMIGSWTSHSI